MEKQKSVSIVSAQGDFIEPQSAKFTPVQREQIYGCEHIFPQLEPILEILKNYRVYHKQGIPVDGGAVLCGLARHGKNHVRAVYRDRRRRPLRGRPRISG